MRHSIFHIEMCLEKTAKNDSPLLGLNFVLAKNHQKKKKAFYVRIYKLQKMFNGMTENHFPLINNHMEWD